MVAGSSLPNRRWLRNWVGAELMIASWSIAGDEQLEFSVWIPWKVFTKRWEQSCLPDRTSNPGDLPKRPFSVAGDWARVFARSFARNAFSTQWSPPSRSNCPAMYRRPLDIDSLTFNITSRCLQSEPRLESANGNRKSAKSQTQSTNGQLEMHV